jgi:hypothetical protein
MRKAVLVICLLNLVLGMGVIFYSLGSFGIWGAFNTWSVAVALLLILLSYYLIGIVDQLEGSPDEDEVTRLEKGAMDSIMKTVDVPHFEKAKTLVDSYRKDEFARPELVLQDHLKERMSAGLKMEQAIEDLYHERGLNV